MFDRYGELIGKERPSIAPSKPPPYLSSRPDLAGQKDWSEKKALHLCVGNDGNTNQARRAQRDRNQ
jgi:hypothetical protein